MLDVQLYGDGQVIYRITGKLYGYLISVVFCDQLRIAEIKIAEYYCHEALYDGTTENHCVMHIKRFLRTFLKFKPVRFIITGLFMNFELLPILTDYAN
jgi:hypothetical protein